MIDPGTMALIAARAAAEKNGTDILVLDVGALIGIVDRFVLVTGNTDRQLIAIRDAIEEALREEDIKPIRREGEDDARWILLDYGDIVVHLFRQEERAYYELERLWKDAPVIEWESADAPR